MMGSTWL